MSRYVMAHIKIPIKVSKKGEIDLLNEYTRTEIEGLDVLPEKPLNDNMYSKIMEYLQTADKKQKEIEEIAPTKMEEEEQQKMMAEEQFQQMQETSDEKESDEKEEEKVEVLYLTEGQIKKRHRTQVQSFKNVGHKPLHFTRKNLV